MSFAAAAGRYEEMTYRRCGASGLKLPEISLGLWQNFGHERPFETSRAILRRAFDPGTTHFDLANNYGPPYGSAEQVFGEVLRLDLAPYRDELVISTKAGYDMWPGPYGEWGSRKDLLASLDQSLSRMGLDYVDIFVSHRFDPETPLEETMEALAAAINHGKALYVGISSYSAEKTREAEAILRDLGVASASTSRLRAPQPLDRGRASGHAWRPRRRLHLFLAARPGRAHRSLPRRNPRGVAREPARLDVAGPAQRGDDGQGTQLDEIAERRGQTLAQLALACTLRDPRMTSTLVGASSIEQLEQNLGALENPDFTADELEEIDRYATDSGINIWAASSEN